MIKKIVIVQAAIIVILSITTYMSYFYNEYFKILVTTSIDQIKVIASKGLKTIIKSWVWLSEQEYNLKLNNREIAILILLAAALIFILLKKDIRKAFVRVVKCLINKKFIKLYIEVFLYTVIVCTILYKIGFWEFYLFKDTLIWVLFSGILISFNSIDNRKNDNLYIDLIKKSFGIAIVIEFLLNIYTYSIILEFVIFIVIIFISLLVATVELQKKDENVEILKKILNGILYFIGINILIFIVIEIIKDYKKLISLENLKSFLLPIILTITFIPYLIYLVSIVLYEDYDIKLKMNKKIKKKYKMFFKLKLFFRCGVNRKKLIEFMNEKRMDIIYMQDFKDMIAIFRK